MKSIVLFSPILFQDYNYTISAKAKKVIALSENCTRVDDKAWQCMTDKMYDFFFGVSELKHGTDVYPVLLTLANSKPEFYSEKPKCSKECISYAAVRFAFFLDYRYFTVIFLFLSLSCLNKKPRALITIFKQIHS